MAQNKEVIIDVTAEDVVVNINGMQGTGCEAISRAFQQLGETKEHRRKPEYFRTQRATVNATQKR